VVLRVGSQAETEAEGATEERARRIAEVEMGRSYLARRTGRALGRVGGLILQREGLCRIVDG